MSRASGESFPTESAKLLAARIALLTQPVQLRLGTRKICPTQDGAIFAVSRCGLGDAGFLPQMLRDGGLDLERIGLAGAHGGEVPDGTIVIGEIRWPVDAESGIPIPSQVPEVLLKPEGARPQAFSILVHAWVSATRMASEGFSQHVEHLLDEVQQHLSCQWWQGLPNHHGRAAMNLHLATKEEAPLKPYEFEQRVMPILKQVAHIGGQDGLLVRFDNPSTNFVIYCADQELLVARGTPCPAGHEHPP